MLSGAPVAAAKTALVAFKRVWLRWWIPSSGCNASLGSWYTWMMSSMLVRVPKVSDITPKAHTRIFFHSLHLPMKDTSYEYLFMNMKIKYLAKLNNNTNKLIFTCLWSYTINYAIFTQTKMKIK